MAGDAERIGLYGFGAAAHIVCQVAIHQGCKVYAFTRPWDTAGQAFARELGAVWAGASDHAPPPVRTRVTAYPLAQAEQALADLRAGAFEGAAVLVP